MLIQHLQLPSLFSTLAISVGVGCSVRTLISIPVLTTAFPNGALSTSSDTLTVFVRGVSLTYK